MSSRYKVMCGCKCCISAKSIHSSFLSWGDRYLKKSRISSKILKIEGLGGKQIAYMKHIKIQSCHMFFLFTPKYIIWQRQQCVYTHSHIMSYHTINLYFNIVPNVQALISLTRKQIISILTPVLQFIFHIYHLIVYCTKDDRLPLTDKKSCRKCQQGTASGQSTKIYTR